MQEKKPVYAKSGRSRRLRSSSQQATDYSVYKLSKKEILLYSGAGLIAAAVIAYIFYRSVIAFLIFMPASAAFPIYMKKVLKTKRIHKLEAQFKDAIIIFSGVLSAGFSPENAMIETENELKLMQANADLIVSEFSIMNHRISLNEPMEKAWEDFARRSASDDIKNFADVLAIAKRSSGDLSDIIVRTADVIGDKIQIKEDMLTITSGKRFEQNIMNCMPVFIVLYIDISTPGFFDYMYTTTAGRIVMTVCLVIYLAAILLAAKILDIEV